MAWFEQAAAREGIVFLSWCSHAGLDDKPVYGQDMKSRGQGYIPRLACVQWRRRALQAVAGQTDWQLIGGP